ncbi:MAG: hypothetical protein ABI369_02640 [Acetobacteraceae bacterium]
MTVPAGLVLFLLLVTFVLSALGYYKLNPERIIVSVPFVLLASPLLLFVVVLAASSLNPLPAMWSVIALIAALVLLGASAYQARCLRPQRR